MIGALLGWYILGILWALLVLVIAGFEDIDTAQAARSFDDVVDWGWWSELLNPFAMSTEEAALVWLPSGIVVLTQFAMLLPAARPLRSDGQPRRPWFAGIMGGVLALILTGGLLLLLADLPRVPVGLGFGAGSPTQSARLIANHQVDHIMRTWMPLAGLAIMLLSWVFWTFILLRALRRSPSGWLAKTVRWLLVGSLVELAIALPIYVIVRRRFDCWCSLPSFWAVVSSLAVVLALWAANVYMSRRLPAPQHVQGGGQPADDGG